VICAIGTPSKESIELFYCTTSNVMTKDTPVPLDLRKPIYSYWTATTTAFHSNNAALKASESISLM